MQSFGRIAFKYIVFLVMFGIVSGCPVSAQISVCEAISGIPDLSESKELIGKVVDMAHGSFIVDADKEYIEIRNVRIPCLIAIESATAGAYMLGQKQFAKVQDMLAMIQKGRPRSVLVVLSGRVDIDRTPVEHLAPPGTPGRFQYGDMGAAPGRIQIRRVVRIIVNL